MAARGTTATGQAHAGAEGQRFGPPEVREDDHPRYEPNGGSAARLGRRELSRRRLAELCIAAGAVLLALWALLPPGLRLVTVVAALAIGTVLERYRQDHQPAPPRLGDTPGSWWHTLRDIGLGYAIGAAASVVVAATVLTVPLKGASGEHDVAPHPERGNAGSVPEIKVRSAEAGQSFRIAGAKFRLLAGKRKGWTQEIRAERPGRGRRWAVVALRVRNLTSKRFNPSRLSYVLRDSRGALYFPDRHGTVGPHDLSSRGALAAGEQAEVRLGFRVPRASRDLLFAFEPKENGPLQVRVPLPRR